MNSCVSIPLLMTDDRFIRVYFIDADSGACFAATESPAEALPESFEGRTTVNLEGREWEVTAAEPMTRREWEETGTLQLTLRPIEVRSVAIDEILYSLPTICDGIPPIAPGTSKLGRNVLELHEDDWRQIELIARARGDEIRRGLEGVGRVYTEQRTPAGAFRQLYLRKEPAEPLKGSGLTLTAVNASFPRPTTAFDGLAYRDVAGLIEGGFALETGSALRLYGQEEAGSVRALCLSAEALRENVEADGTALAGLMRAHELVLVDWCEARLVENSDTEVVGYLQSRAAVP